MIEIKKFKGGSLEKWIKDIMIKETEKQNSKFSWNLADWQVRYSEMFAALAVVGIITVLAFLLIYNATF